MDKEYWVVGLQFNVSGCPPFCDALNSNAHSMPKRITIPKISNDVLRGLMHEI